MSRDIWENEKKKEKKLIKKDSAVFGHVIFNLFFDGFMKEKSIWF